MKAKIYLFSTLLAALTFASCGGEKHEDDHAADHKDTTAAEHTEKEKETEEVAPPMDSAAMMKAWMDFMTPGDMHKMLAKYDGTWNGEVTTWMDPNKPESKSQSVTVNKMVFNGLYQESKHVGSFDGMPFQGMSMTGYDNAKKKFVSTWVDNMGSGIMVMEGTYDEATKTINLTGTATDPMTGKTCAQRQVLKLVDDNTQVMEMYGSDPTGKEMKMMEIKYTRKK